MISLNKLYDLCDFIADLYAYEEKPGELYTKKDAAVDMEGYRDCMDAEDLEVLEGVTPADFAEAYNRCVLAYWKSFHVTGAEKVAELSEKLLPVSGPYAGHIMVTVDTKTGKASGKYYARPCEGPSLEARGRKFNALILASPASADEIIAGILSNLLSRFQP